MTTKVIILDIDGPICNRRSHLVTGKRGVWRNPDVIILQALRKICQEQGMQIVLCSSWRKEDSVLEYMTQWGLFNYLHKDWHTPFHINIGEITGNPFYSGDPRGYEIKEWLKIHPEIVDYRIIEDSPLETHKDLQSKLIHADPMQGLDVNAIRDLMEWAGYYK